MRIVFQASRINYRRIALQTLFYFAAACLFASLATAPGQLYLGIFYYSKDAGALLSLMVLSWLAVARGDRLAMLVTASSAVLGLIFIPALLLGRDETAATGLTIMWNIKWAVAAHLGILLRRERLYKEAAVCGSVLMAILLVDGLIGLWEIHTQGYFFEMSAKDETAAGVAMVKQEHVGELIRVLSIHRSGGDFGNSMATGMILCGGLLLMARRIWIRLLAAPALFLFCFDLFYSTVRSFLVGAVLAVCAAAGYLLIPGLVKRFATPILYATIGLALFFSCFNIIPMVEFVSHHFLNDTAIGNVESSYMRLDTWDDVLRDIRSTPAVVFTGGPIASALSLGAPPSNICDNIYLWLFYHGGMFGFLTFILLIPLPLLPRVNETSRALYFTAAVQLLVTGIFTDSLFYFSSLLLFFALGLIFGEAYGQAGSRIIRFRLRQSDEPALCSRTV